MSDLSVIDQDGKHLAYVGPYDLMDKNYSQTFWFKTVMEKGIYISDMFMGFRKVPHFIIAVARQEGEKSGSCGRPSTRRRFAPWWRT